MMETMMMEGEDDDDMVRILCLFSLYDVSRCERGFASRHHGVRKLLFFKSTMIVLTYAHTHIHAHIQSF